MKIPLTPCIADANKISFICSFPFVCYILYKALDLNLDFSKFRLTFKFNEVEYS